jgi:large subunit ribosomal protein L20
LKHAKGYRGRSKNCFTIAIRRVEKAWQYAYRDRKVKKRMWRTLWIQRLSAASRQYHMNYSRLIATLKYANVPLNRKVLSELAATEPFAFKSVMDVLQHHTEAYQLQKRQRMQQQQQQQRTTNNTTAMLTGQ